MYRSFNLEIDIVSTQNVSLIRPDDRWTMDIKSLLWPGEKKKRGGGGEGQMNLSGTHNFPSPRDWTTDDLEISFPFGGPTKTY